MTYQKIVLNNIIFKILEAKIELVEFWWKERDYSVGMSKILEVFELWMWINSDCKKAHIYFVLHNKLR